ncbi:hypothetical protein ACJJTC_011154 [Scirpophaga incertulas]
MVDISTCDIGANEECLASVASYSSESSLTALVSDSDVKSQGFSIKGEKRPRHKEQRSKGKRSKVFIEDSSLSIPLRQHDPSSQDSSILLGQNQSTNNEQTELNSIINVISGSVADTQTTQLSHVLSDRQPVGRQNHCVSDKGPFNVHIQKKKKSQFFDQYSILRENMSNVFKLKLTALGHPNPESFNCEGKNISHFGQLPGRARHRVFPQRRASRQPPGERRGSAGLSSWAPPVEPRL